MKRILSLFSLMIIACALLAGLFIFNNSAETGDNISVNDKIEGIPDPHGLTKNKTKRGAKGYMEFLAQIRAGVDGEVNIADVIAARKQAAVLRSKRSAGLGLQWESMGPDNVGGRTRAILIDRNNPSRMYAGGVTGGLWTSNDGGVNWNSYTKNDTLNGIGVTSFTQAANGDIYLGTGELFAVNSPAGITIQTGMFLGEGVFKSTDGGETFFHLSATTPSVDNNPNGNWSYVPKMAAHPTDPNIIYAGTNSGLWKTTDGGTTWNKIIGGFISERIYDLDILPDGIVFVVGGSAFSAKIYRSIDANNPDDIKALNQLPGGNFPLTSSTRFKVDYAESDPNYIYIIGCNSSGQTNAVKKSTDRGITWTDFGPPTLPSSIFNPTGTQGWYDMEIKVNPADKNRVYVGGQYSFWEWTSTSGWYPISNWYSTPGIDPRYVHADHHEIEFHPTNPDIMYVGTDGGIFRSVNARVDLPSLPTFQPFNKSYSTTQFYSVSAGIDGSVMGGTQDNGTIYIDYTGNTLRTGKGVLGGDGGFSDISKSNPNALFFSVQNGGLRRSSNGGESYNFYFDTHIDSEPDNSIDCGAPFITPFRLWENLDDTDPNYGEGRIFVSTNCGVWMATDALNFAQTPTWFRVAGPTTGLSGIPSYIEISEDGDIAYIGTSAGRVYRVSGLRNANYDYIDYLNTPTEPADDQFFPDSVGIKSTLIAVFGQYVTGIGVDKNNPDHVAVSLGQYGQSNYIYRSTTAATDTGITAGIGSFKSIQGIGSSALPKMPVYSVVIDYYNPSNIIVGTELGIYSTSNGGSTNPSWSPDNSGLPYTANFMLRQEKIDEINKNCYVLYVGTHGRGIWRTTTLTPSGCKTAVPIVGINESNKAKNNIAVFPNPVKDYANLTIELSNSASATLEIFDMMGRKVKTQSLGTVNAGKQTLQVDMTNIPSGTYVLAVNVGKERLTHMIVVGK